MLVLLSQTAPTKDGVFLPLSKYKKASYVGRMLSGWTNGVRICRTDVWKVLEAFFVQAYLFGSMGSIHWVGGLSICRM